MLPLWGHHIQVLFSCSEDMLDVSRLVDISTAVQQRYKEVYNYDSPHLMRRFRQFEQPFERPPLLTIFKTCDALTRGLIEDLTHQPFNQKGLYACLLL